LRDALPSEIPVIDVSLIFSSSLEDRKSVAQQVRDAATNTGFFYIKNHGVPGKVTDDSYQVALEFFRQDLEKKNEISIHKSVSFNGFRALGTQSINPDDGVDVRENFSIMYDPRIDPGVKAVQDIPADVMEQIRLEDDYWESTKSVPGFKDALLSQYQSWLSLARALTRTFALSLDLPETAFDSKVAYPDGALYLNYYPPMSDGSKLLPADPDALYSIGSHTDFTLFTILWQDDLGGLQVLNRQGQWINARPMPGTFVINIADYMQRITNDRYLSNIHRARNVSGKERVSVTLFWGFGYHETCSVLETCLELGEKAKYEPVNCGEWVRKRVADMVIG
jgi:isopenicillin N synthase-like dioxygenase